MDFIKTMTRDITLSYLCIFLYDDGSSVETTTTRRSSVDDDGDDDRGRGRRERINVFTALGSMRHGVWETRVSSVFGG